MIFVLSFLVPDAIVSEPFTVPYIETIERIQADSAHAIAGQSARVNQPRISGMRSRLVYWMGSTDDCEYNTRVKQAPPRGRMYRMEKAHRLVQQADRQGE